MKRLAFFLPLLALACGGDSGTEPPPPDPIVELVVAQPDTGFFLGEGLAFSDIVTGAVTESGAVVPVPDDLVWSVPSGFAVRNDSVVGTREARGTLVVSTDVPEGVSGASVVAAAEEVGLNTLTDLSAVVGWSSTQSCYEAPEVRRGDETIGVDSVQITRNGSTLEYDTETGWTDVWAVRIPVTEQVVRWWKDGVIDTLNNTSAISAVQDTARLSLGGTFGPEADGNMTRISDEPVVYVLGPPGTCSTVWEGGGTEFRLVGG